MKSQRQSLIAEIDERCDAVSASRVHQMVMSLLTQYLAQASRCSAEQLELYDDALLVLIKRLNPAKLSDVSQQLAQSQPSPARTLAFLAQNTDIEIAGPILQHAQVDADVIKAVVNAKRGPQLMAVASRRSVPSDVCILLIQSDIPAVIGQTVKNHGAVLSEMAFSLLIGLAAKDKELARLIALRTDIPEELRSFIDMILQ